MRFYVHVARGDLRQNIRFRGRLASGFCDQSGA